MLVPKIALCSGQSYMLLVRTGKLAEFLHIVKLQSCLQFCLGFCEQFDCLSIRKLQRSRREFRKGNKNVGRLLYQERSLAE